MAQAFPLPQGFTTAPPNATQGGGFALPRGFSTTPPANAAPPAAVPQQNSWLDNLANVTRDVPLLGTLTQGARAAGQLGNVLNSAPAPGPNERRGELAPIIRDEKTGAFRPAWPQIALDAASAFQLPGDVASGKTPLDLTSVNGQDPATMSRAMTLASMVGGGSPMGSPAARAMVTVDGKALPKILMSDLTKSGINPADLNAKIAGIGPGAVLADVSPVLQSRAAYLAKFPDQTQQTIFDTLTARQQGAGPRVQRALGDIAGPEPVPSAIAAGVQARKDMIGPFYTKLFDSTKATVPTRDIVANINGNAAMTRGPTQQAYARIAAMFNNAPAVAESTGQKVTTDPRIVFEIRNTIDGLLATEANPKVIGALTGMRQKIDTALGNAVPGLKKLDAFYQEQERQAEGFDYGRAALRSDPGAAPIHPDDLAAKMQETVMKSSLGPMATPSQVPGFIGQGMLSKIYEIVGNNTNDRISLKKIITGEGKWNYQKIASALGQDKADKLLALFNNEATMANTENLAMANSKTARLMAGGQGLEPNQNANGVLRKALNFDFGDAAFAAASKVTGGAFDAARARRNAELAQLLMRGPTFGTRLRPPSGVMTGLANANNAAAINELTDYHRRRLLGVN